MAAAGLTLGLGIPLFMGGRELGPVLARLSWPWLAMLLLLVFIGWNLNAGRLRLLAGGVGARLGQGRALSTIMATEFAICATPGGAGGPVTYAWLLGRQGLPLPRGLALYAVDQLMDMLFFLTVLVALFMNWLLMPSDLQLGWQIGVLGALLMGGLGLIWLLTHHYRPVALASGRLLRRLQIAPARRRRLARWMVEFRHSLRLVRQFSHLRLLGIYLFCVGHWLLRYSLLYLAIAGLGGGISWSYAFIAQMLSHTAGQATFLPGGSGGAEVSSMLLLAPYLDSATAAAAILVWRFATFYWYLIAGAPVFALLAGRPMWRRLADREDGDGFEAQAPHNRESNP